MMRSISYINTKLVKVSIDMTTLEDNSSISSKVKLHITQQWSITQQLYSLSYTIDLLHIGIRIFMAIVCIRMKIC